METKILQLYNVTEQQKIQKQHSSFKILLAEKNNRWTNPDILWEVVEGTKLYNSKEERCNFCLLEKFTILQNIDSSNLLNKGSEWKHKNKYLLKNGEPN